MLPYNSQGFAGISCWLLLLLGFLSASGLQAQTTYYTYNAASTQDWTTPTRWTTDPGGAGFPGAGIPTGGPGGGNGGGAASDRIVLRAGATVDLTFDNLTVAAIELQPNATLNLMTSSGHTLGTVKGQGTLRLEPTAASGNTAYELPSGSWTNFLGASGGTLELSGGGGAIFASPVLTDASVSLNNTNGTISTTTIANFGTFNHVVVSGSGTKTFPAGRHRFLGDLRIEASASVNLAGDYRFRIMGDFVNASSAPLGFDGHTNLTTNANYTSLATNQIYLKGDLINEGNGGSRMDFTSKTSPSNANVAATSLLFDNHFANQAFTANGEVRIENLIINKGIDPTYQLLCTTDGANQFRLLGYNNQTPQWGSSDTPRDFALALNSGAVSIGPNIDFEIGRIGYVTSQDARFICNGGRVTQGSGSGGGWVNWGTMECSNGGEIDIRDRRLVIRVPGVIVLNDGTISAGSFRTATAGGIHEGAYIQNGGLLHLAGAAPSNPRARFILEYASNTFQMSGGTIHIENDNLRSEGSGLDRGIDIRAQPSNVSVNGGRILVELSDNTSDAFVINSSAPFYNLEIQGNGTGDNVALQEITGPNPGGAAPTAPQPLVVLNDFILGAGVTFDAQDEDVTIGHNMRLGAGARYNVGSQRTTFNTSSFAELELLAPAENYNLSFDTLVVDKPASSRLELLSPGRTTNPADALSLFATVEDALYVNGGRFDYRGFRLRLNGDAIIADDLGQLSSTGRLLIDDGAPHELAVGFQAAPTIGHLEIGDATTVTLTGDDLGEIGTLTLSGTTGLFDIGPYRLPVRNALANGGNPWGLDKSIRVAGNFSDRGLGRYLDGNGLYLFPLSTAANSTPRYTPVTATISGFPGADAGYLDFSLVDQAHPSLNSAAPANSALTFFFRARTSGFGATPPQAVYDFVYADADEVPSPTGAMVPGKIVNADRLFEDAADYDAAANTIQFDEGGTFPVETGDYTAGNDLNFDGGVQVFFSRFETSGPYSNTNVLPGQPDNACCGIGQAWNATTTWSEVSHNGPVSGAIPGRGDIVYIAPDHRIYAGDATTGDPFNTDDTPVYASTLHLGGSLFFRGDNALQNSEIQEVRDTTGTGNLFLEADGNSPSAVPDMDIADYASTAANEVIYRWVQTAADGTFEVPGTYRSYPSLTFFGAGGQNAQELWDGTGLSSTLRRYRLPANDLIVNGTMNINTGCLVELNGTDPANGDLLIRQDFVTGNANQNTGMLEYPSTGNPRTLTVLGNIEINYAGRSGEPAGIRVQTGGSAIEHALRLQGDLTLGDPALDTEFAVLAFNETAKIHLFLDGDSSGTYRRLSSSGSVNLPDFYRVTIDKNAGQADTFHFAASFNIDNSLANAALSSGKNFVINSGIARLADPAIDLTLSTGGANYLLPQPGGLLLDNGAVARIDNPVGAASDLKLVGSLRLQNTSGASPRTELLLASADVAEATDLIYSPSASARISVLDDAYLSIGGQLRREAIPPVGGLSYTQGGSSLVQIGEEINNSEPTTYITTRGVFDLVGGTGSSFTMTGGTLQIMQEVPGASIAELLLQSDSFSMTGGTIALGASGMSAGQTLTLNADVGHELYNLEVVDAGVAFTADLGVNPLVVTNELAIRGSNSTFRAQNLDVTLRGNFLNEGSYSTSGNTTALEGTAPQTVTLNAPTSFSNLRIANAGNTIALAGSESSAIVEESLTLAAGTLDLTDKRLEVRGDVTNDATVINSSGGELRLNSSAGLQLLRGNGAGQVGNLNVANGDGLLMEAAARVNGTLTLTTGRLVASFHALTLGPNADVVNFDATRYIQTEGTNSSAGVTKVINTPGSFTLPVGNSTRYGPATYNVTSLTTPGELTLKPINGPPSEYTDPANLWGVNFHWVVATGAGLDIASLTHTYTYNDADRQTPAQESNVDWTAGYIFSGASSWVRSNTVGVDIVANEATFNNNSANNLAAIYAVGRDTELDAVREYWSATSGDYSVLSTWSTVPPSNGSYPTTPTVLPDPAVAPTGGAGTVHIVNGHTVTLQRNNIEVFVMDIQAGGTLAVQDYIGANFRSVTGSGRAIMTPAGSNANLPSADWSAFVAAGGTLVFGGSNDYNLPAPAQLATMPNVELMGSGDRTVAVTNTLINNDLALDGPALRLAGNNLRLNGDLTYTSGSLVPSSGRLTLQGTGDQTLSGALTQANNAALFDLTLAKTGGDLLLGSGTTLEVLGELAWQQPALVQTDASRTLLLGPAATVSGAGGGRYVNGPLQRSIFDGASFTFPIGKSGQYRPARAFNVNMVGSDVLEAEYYPTTLGGSTTSPIYAIEQNAHWRFEANAGIGTRFHLFWDSPVAGYDAPAHVVKSASQDATMPIQDEGGINQAGALTATGEIQGVNNHTFASPIYVAVGYEINPLPVELLSFTGQLAGEAAQLRWQTTKEVNSLLYEVQRSTQGVAAFEAIGAVAAAGNATVTQSYTFVDAKLPAAPLVYYRLKQVDLDGSYDYSNVIALRPGQALSAEAPQWRVGPNPTRGWDLQLHALQDQDSQATARLISPEGRLLLQQTAPLPALQNLLAQRLQDLPAAIYALQLSHRGHYQQLRLVKY